MSGTTIQLAVTYRGTSHSISQDAQSTLFNLQSQLELLTSVAPELQKLLYRGKRPMPPGRDVSEVTIEEVGLKDGVKVTLIGSTTEEINGMKQTEEEKQKREEILRRRQAAGPPKVRSLDRSGHEYVDLNAYVTPLTGVLFFSRVIFSSTIPFPPYRTSTTPAEPSGSDGAPTEALVGSGDSARDGDASVFRRGTDGARSA